MFEKISESLSSAIGKIRHFDDEKSLKKATGELKKSLLKADIHYKITKDLLVEVEKRTKANGIGKESFQKALSDTFNEILESAGSGGFVFAPNPPTKVLMMGLQGSGKTTTTAKLAHYLKQRKKKVLMVAADLQRLAAVEQLKQLGEQTETEVFYKDGADPTTVVKEGLKRAKDGLFDVVIFDTAGRLAIDEELMGELKTVKDIVSPDETFYVADSMTGQDSVKTADSFNQQIGISGVILTKFDGDPTGGVAIGLAKQIGVPLRFLGVGEKIADLELFVADRIVSRLMGAGDVEGLAEKVGTIIDEKKAKEITKKIRKGAFNFNDFLEQMEQMKKLGSMKSIIGMIPGMGNLGKQLGDIDLENSKEILHIKALISSMTKRERENPDILNPSRKKRLATGAGLSEVQVNKILKQFKNAAKMAKKLSGKKGMADLQAMMGQMGGPGGFPR
ncbi:MAG: signal recognition particle protein Srp54 [Campylobacterales bacterium]|nr:signal recognition particle protein Srp54 [Campylobacterales bacterium]